MGNGLVLYQGALLHEQFVALVTLEPLESICCYTYIVYIALIERELTSAQVWYLRAVAVGKTFSHLSHANVCEFVFCVLLY